MVIPFLKLLFNPNDIIENQQAANPEFKLEISYFIDLFNYHFSKIIIEQGKSDALLFVCIIVITVFFFKNTFRFAAMYFLAPIRHGVVFDIRNQMFEKILNLPLSYFSEENKGDLLTRMTVDVNEIEFSIMSMLEVTFREPFTILVFLGTMIFMSPQLTLFVFIMLITTALIVGRIGKSLKKTSAKGQSELGKIMKIIDESIGGLRIIKAFTAEKFQSKNFKAVNETYTRLANQMQRRKDLSSPLSEFLGISIVVIVLWYGGQMALNQSNQLSPEAFIGFMAIFSQLIPPAKNFSSAYYHIQKGLASADRIFHILDTDNNIHEIEHPIEVKDFQFGLELKDVSFRYSSHNQSVLKNINLKIEKGKMIALVGLSGSGKSTLVNLLPRFYDATEGIVLVDNIPIKNLKINSVRKLFGIVNQEPILFNDTIYNNIAFGSENVENSKVIDAAKMANAHEFIIQQPNGYDTIIGDSGNKLSGGQKQRITIARALLNNPPILILDEATSSLDSESEKWVQDAIQKIMKNRTSIVIAHRLSTIQSADEVIVMNQGEIIERGKHHELIALGGKYARLVEMQQM